MILQELLSTKHHDVETNYDDDDVLDLTAKIGGRDVFFYADMHVDYENKKHLYVEFSEKKGEKKKSYDLTGSGSEFQVFSFIKNSIEKAIKKWNPDIIAFSADKESREVLGTRADLYEKLFKKFLPGWKIKKEQHEKHVDFVLEKP